MLWEKIVELQNCPVTLATTFATFSTADVDADVMLARWHFIDYGEDEAVDQRDQDDQKAPEVHVQAEKNRLHFYCADQRQVSRFINRVARFF
jgi:hypothetical protein